MCARLECTATRNRGRERRDWRRARGRVLQGERNRDGRGGDVGKRVVRRKQITLRVRFKQMFTSWILKCEGGG